VPAGDTPPALRPRGPAGGSQPPGQLAPAEAPRPIPPRGESPEPHGARLAARLRLGDAGSRPLQAAGPGRINSDPVHKVLGAVVLELGLDRADEMRGLWLGHHEFDSPSDLPAG
ncbi:CITE1 protein, partial [Pardalotus punctatus]|nr:CITE1 protein [Pardalotus punctatus]